MLHPVVSAAVVHWTGRCFLLAPWKSYTSIVTLKILHKKPQILQSCFPLLWFLIHTIHDIFVCFLYQSDQLFFVWYNIWLLFSVYPKLCQQSKQLCSPKFWQTTIDFERKFFQILHFADWFVVGNVGKITDQDFPNCIVLFNYTGHHTEMMIGWQI